jgi:hypothetical protein
MEYERDPSVNRYCVFFWFFLKAVDLVEYDRILINPNCSDVS